MKLVTWPTSKELTKDTTTVLTTVLLFAIFFAVVDFGIVELMELILQ